MIISKAPMPDRLFTLDVLRGLAALSVVFFHWQHFFYDCRAIESFKTENQPFFSLFSIFYTHGSLAVELFFSISGFVFFWLFLSKISEKKISALSFTVDRFSRLYPLHFFTFITVMLLQFVYIKSHGDFFVYRTNDAYHALLNLLLVPAWGFEYDWSFNAPIWSVSVEILLYAIFFLICLSGRAKYMLTPILIGAGYYLIEISPKVGTGVFSFFCGGMAYIVINLASTHVATKISLVVSTILTFVAWVYVYQSPALNMYTLMGLAFPLSVCALVSANMAYPNFLRKLSPIGDISYSTYLLHFPLQIVFACITDKLGFDRAIYYNPAMLILFVAVLLVLSISSHKFFEAPIQQTIRSAFKKRAVRLDSI